MCETGTFWLNLKAFSHLCGWSLQVLHGLLHDTVSAHREMSKVSVRLHGILEPGLRSAWFFVLRPHPLGSASEGKRSGAESQSGINPARCCAPWKSSADKAC